MGFGENKDRKTVSVFDPIHTLSEENIIQLLGFECISKQDNLEGKYALGNETCSGTLFYLPHCPKELTNNILKENWKPESLGSNDHTSCDSCRHGLYILGNSFDKITTSLPDRILW